jgi:hypothetical protein
MLIYRKKKRNFMPIAAPAVMGNKTYQQKIISLFGSSLIGYWMLNEASGGVAFDVSGKTVDLIVNGGFETAGAGAPDYFGTWAETAGDGAIADEGVIINAGSHAAKLTAGATANTFVSQDIVVRAGITYNFSFYTRGDGTNSGRYGVYDLSNTADLIAQITTGIAGTTYTKFQVSFTTPAGCISVRVYVSCPAINTGIAYFDDVSVLAPMHGLYTGVDLANANGPAKTKTKAPYFDGANDYVNIFSAPLASYLSGTLGTLGIWCKLNGSWAGTTRYHAIRFLADANNYVYIEKSGTVNQWKFALNSGGAIAQVLDATAYSLGSAWFLSVLTWDKAANELKGYVNNAQVGTTQAIAGTWAGSATTALIGAATLTPVYVWDGWLAHAFILNRVAALAEIQTAYSLGA